MIELRERAAIVFKQDGFYKEDVENDLKTYGNIEDCIDTSLTYINEDDEEIEEPVWLYIINGKLGDIFRMTLSYNCFSQEVDGVKVYFPRG